MASLMNMQVIRLSFAQLVELLRSLDGQRLLKTALPPDARILSVYENHPKDSLDLILQSSESTPSELTSSASAALGAETSAASSSTLVARAD